MDPKDEQDKALRQAAVARAQSHEALVNANSDTLAQAALTLIGLDSDPRALDRWFDDGSDETESGAA